MENRAEGEGKPLPPLKRPGWRGFLDEIRVLHTADIRTYVRWSVRDCFQDALNTPGISKEAKERFRAKYAKYLDPK